MRTSIIRLSSVTYAIRAQKLLEQQGIRSYVKKLTKSVQIHGCGYGVEIYGDPGPASQIIAAAGIRIIEIAVGE